jgi:predicted transcriptional regulator
VCSKRSRRRWAADRSVGPLSCSLTLVSRGAIGGPATWVLRNHFCSMTFEMYDQLSRLERRIMDAVYRLGTAAATDVVSELGEKDAHDSIRVTMANLKKKGYLTHKREETRNIYAPTISERRARASAMEHLMRTFFDDSPSGAILGLLDMSAGALTEKDIAEIRAHIKDVEKPEGD